MLLTKSMCYSIEYILLMWHLCFSRQWRIHWFVNWWQVGNNYNKQPPQTQRNHVWYYAFDYDMFMRIVKRWWSIFTIVWITWVNGTETLSFWREQVIHSVVDSICKQPLGISFPLWNWVHDFNLVIQRIRKESCCYQSLCRIRAIDSSAFPFPLCPSSKDMRWEEVLRWQPALISGILKWNWAIRYE